MARLEELERKFEENRRRYFAPLANEYRKAGDAQRAADLCRSQLPEVPGHISGHIVLGQALYDARDFDGSRAALETALALDPENIVALRYLGDIARDTGDAAEAERWYSRTLEADPYNEAATTALQLLRASPATADEPLPSATQQVTEETPQLVGEYAQPAEESPQPAGEYAQLAEESPQPAGEYAQPAEESPQPAEDYSRPTDDVVAASPEPLPTTASPAAGFDPTSHAEPVPEPTGAPSVVDVAPVKVADAGPTAAPTEPLEQATEALTEPVKEAGAEASEAAEPAVQAEPELEPSASGVLTVNREFAGDLSVSSEPETVEPAIDELSTEPETTEPAIDEPSAAPATLHAPAEPEVLHAPAEPEALHTPAEPATLHAPAEPETLHAPAEPATIEEAIQAEERVLESAAPFVTETMADLYLEQGYPHEALELLLQLSEQRPNDEQLRARIEHIESVIVARRDAAVAAARAERAERTEAAAIETPEDAVEAVEATKPPDAPFDAAVAEVDWSAFAASEPEPEERISVRELFARMDRARPRAASSVTPRPISRRRSDFVPMPEGDQSESAASDDPFAFPNQPAPAPVPRTSGPQQTFNPSTADSDDFDAWLRGLKGP